MATWKQLGLLPYPKKKHHKEMAKTSNAPSSLEEKDQRSLGFFKNNFYYYFLLLISVALVTAIKHSRVK